MRTYRSATSDEIRELLTQLTLPPERTGPNEYRAAMTRLGEQFIWVFSDQLAGIKRLLLVCTNEDADYLARGVLNGLWARGAPAVSVACFWNERESISGTISGRKVDLAPIVRRYVEPGETDAFLVVKSIISSACVVRTNITELVYQRDPGRVLIFAPVVLKGANQRVRQEFEADISQRFEFYWFAEDDEKEGENVKPGIGGQVYERLGIGTRAEKNRYIPNLVRERRRAGARACTWLVFGSTAR
jgi:hypothetical protein